MKRAGFRISRRFAAATERRSGMPEVGLRANGAAAWDDWAVKAITYLSPGIPLDLYATIAHHLADALDEPVELTSDARFSGPSADEPNPLTDGDVDLAFICGPSYLRLADEVQLVAAAPVFDDPRTQGRPEYFAEVVVAADRIERSLDELVGARFAYNDPASLSGRLAVLAHLGSMEPRQFAGAVQSGSSEASLVLITTDGADVCSVDSDVWRRLVSERPGLLRRFRVMQSLGPFPIQPVVASPRMDAQRLERVTATLLSLGEDELGWFGVTGFAPVSAEDYLPLGMFLARLTDRGRRARIAGPGRPEPTSRETANARPARAPG